MMAWTKTEVVVGVKSAQGPAYMLKVEQPKGFADGLDMGYEKRSIFKDHCKILA